MDPTKSIEGITMNRNKFYREIVLICLGAGTIFFTLALISFNASDNSWFFYTSRQVQTTNYCGPVGADIAALFLFMFGAGAFVLIPFCTYLLFFIAFKKRFLDEWDRIGSFVLLLSTFALLSSAHGLNSFARTLPGGLLGANLLNLSTHLFDIVGTFVFAYTALLISLILIIRFSLIDALHAMYGLFARPFLKQGLAKPFWVLKKVGGAVSFPIVALVGKCKGRGVKTSSIAFDNDYKSKQINRMLSDQPEVEYTYEQKSQPQAEKPKKVYKRTGLGTYNLPTKDLFTKHMQHIEDTTVVSELEERAYTLQEKLGRFGVKGQVVNIKRGPVVTLFEYEPEIDSKISKIIALEDDLALALQALSIRILAPIPGRAVVGFEVANKNRRDVLFSKIVHSSQFQKDTLRLPLILGEDTTGNEVIVDLAKMPHLLIAGSTGSGKSVALNAMLISLLCKRSPQELKLILVDPKRLEFANYADIAHLLFPIVTNAKQAAPVLKWVVKEMERRYEMMAEFGARNIFDYQQAQAKNDEELPFIVVVIDELSDLMMLTGKEVEDLITRIAQMARAAGIHLIIATQRPSVDVITGLIKVNFPSRVSFRVSSKIDSRTILDASGAEKLLGRGDMLFMDSSSAQLKRVHGAYVSDADIQKVVNHIKQEQEVHYLELMQEQIPDGLLEADDQIYQEIVDYLEQVDEVSISLLQRKFRIGYNRSARIIETLESQGYITSSQGGKTRKVVR